MKNLNSKMFLSKYMEKNIDISKLGNKTCIISGVGSGKNYWAEQELTKHGNVLLITSRKAKKDETKTKNPFNGEHETKEIDYNYVCTNAALEVIIKSAVISGNYESFCSNFNYIVVDEAHSLVTDSTYTDASFHLWTFIKEISKIKPIILMTGTIKPKKSLLDENGWQMIDCMEECINIKPKKIVIETKENIIKTIAKEKEAKVIYMANSATNIATDKNNLYEEFLEKCKYKKEEIAFSMSDSKAEELLKSKLPEEYERMQQTYSSLTDEQKIPEDIKLLITTSRLKEGINIENEDVKYVICESHSSADMLQLAGRVRNGYDTFYIVDDVRQNNNNNLSELDYNFSKENGTEACNSYLSKIKDTPDDILQDIFKIKLSKATTNASVRKFIKFVESDRKFQYIRYNHLVNKFETYELRHLAVEQFKNDMAQYQENQTDYIRKTFDVSINNIENKILGKKIYEKKLDDFWLENLEINLKSWSISGKNVFGTDNIKLMKKRICKSLGLKSNASILSINEELTKRKLPFVAIYKKYKKNPHRDEYYLTIVEKEI